MALEADTDADLSDLFAKLDTNGDGLCDKEKLYVGDNDSDESSQQSIE